MLWSRYAACLFDLDGVLTPTAAIHRRAWQETFDSLLGPLPGQPLFSGDDYFRYVDGKPRIDGVRDLLVSRGIRLPEGRPDDPPEADTVAGLGNRKNLAFNRVLARDGIAPYPGVARLLGHLAGRGVGLAVVSSSRNAKPVLRAAGLLERFPVIVDGNAVVSGHLAGKPAPDTFLRAAALLGQPAARCVVLEDAISGVAAGVAGGFGLVVGVDRGAGEAALKAAGAGLVVDDLTRLVQS